ncbi:hypothetical protein OGATHE_004942 [Ogataea polymorpha]|uniref:Uncharacterized protein n=1 Tax=Ogataea polymorpha TaxID=460523 RepID=A0A9P8NW49_9ASCO|nr:hypothetical protein OGATHE_004942 [Ogataea polymorpha]
MLVNTSQVPNIIMLFGTVRIRWGVRPPYIDAKPSSLMTSLKHWIRPVYLGLPSCDGACLSRVLTTSCGYVIRLATNLATPADPDRANQSIISLGFLPSFCILSDRR